MPLYVIANNLSDYMAILEYYAAVATVQKGNSWESEYFGDDLLSYGHAYWNFEIGQTKER